MIFDKILFYTHVIATGIMTVVIWYIQIHKYPSFANAPKETFVNFHFHYSAQITWVVTLPMLLELLGGAYLLWRRPAGWPLWLSLAGFSLILIIWISTWALQVPMHNILSQGFDYEAHQKLVSTNWIRTVAWSLRFFLINFYFLSRLHERYGWFLKRGFDGG